MCSLLSIRETTIADFLYCLSYRGKYNDKLQATGRISLTNISRSLNPPGTEYWEIPAAVLAIDATEAQLFWISPVILHEFPTPLPHVHTLSNPQEHRENSIGWETDFSALPKS